MNIWPFSKNFSHDADEMTRLYAKHRLNLILARCIEDHVVKGGFILLIEGFRHQETSLCCLVLLHK